MAEQLIGNVTHYYSRIGAAALNLLEPLRVGDKIHIEGHTTDFVETVDSMEIDHRKTASARPGDDVAIKVAGKVRSGDRVYREMD